MVLRCSRKTYSQSCRATFQIHRRETHARNMEKPSHANSLPASVNAALRSRAFFTDREHSAARSTPTGFMTLTTTTIIAGIVTEWFFIRAGRETPARTHVDFRKRNGDEQKQYWDWRHSHQ